MAEESNLTLPSSDNPKDSVIYQPLEANHIRVLRILPATEPDFSDTISCQLSEEYLDSDPRPKYRALSYVWGDPSNPKTVLLGGQPFPVRNNLWAFLAQARKDGYTDPLWIDAVCINQDDTDERSKQVAIMGRIYRSATDVRVWLEDENGKIERAVDGINNFDWQLEAGQIKGGKERSTMELNWMLQIYQSRYWLRLWVVQEFILAPYITIQAGRCVIQEEALRDIILDVKRHPVDDPATNMFQAREKYTHSGGNTATIYDFMLLLIRFSSHQCTDPRDRVYALITWNQDASMKIVSDSSKTIVQVFEQVTSYLSRGLENANSTYYLLAHIAAESLQSGLGLGDCSEATSARRSLLRNSQPLS